MDQSECAGESGKESPTDGTALSAPSGQPIDQQSSSDSRGRSSRRKPIKTHKVSANFEDVDHYDDYLRDGIPDSLLEGLGFNESNDQASGSGSPSHTDYEMDVANISPFMVTANAAGHIPTSGAKRRGRPPGRGRGRGTTTSASFQPAAVQPNPVPLGGRRRGRPPKSVTPAPTRVQPARVIAPAPVQVHVVQQPKGAAPLLSIRTDTSHNNASSAAWTSLSHIPNSVAMSLLPVTEFNVWPVLEKLLAATQSMGMLLGSLKDDLKRTTAMIAAASIGSPVVEHGRKRREVATKLWRAFVAYKKSFDEIESFTRNTNVNAGGVNNAPSAISNANKPVQKAPVVRSVEATPPPVTAKVPNQNETTQPSSTTRRRRPVQSKIVIELSDSDDDDGGKDNGGSSPSMKKPKLEDTDEVNVNEVQPTSQIVQSRSDVETDIDPNTVGKKVADENTVTSSNVVAPTDSSPAQNVQNGLSEANVVARLVSGDQTAELLQTAKNSAADDDIDRTSNAANTEASANESTDLKAADGSSDDQSEKRESISSKTELFSSLRFEPLFEIQPLNGGDKS